MVGHIPCPARPHQRPNCLIRILAGSTSKKSPPHSSRSATWPFSSWACKRFTQLVILHERGNRIAVLGILHACCPRDLRCANRCEARAIFFYHLLLLVRLHGLGPTLVNSASAAAVSLCSSPWLTIPPRTSIGRMRALAKYSAGSVMTGRARPWRHMTSTNGESQGVVPFLGRSPTTPRISGKVQGWLCAYLEHGPAKYPTSKVSSICARTPATTAATTGCPTCSCSAGVEWTLFSRQTHRTHLLTASRSPSVMLAYEAKAARVCFQAGPRYGPAGARC